MLLSPWPWLAWGLLFWFLSSVIKLATKSLLSLFCSFIWAREALSSAFSAWDFLKSSWICFNWATLSFWLWLSFSSTTELISPISLVLAVLDNTSFVAGAVDTTLVVSLVPASKAASSSAFFFWAKQLLYCASSRCLSLRLAAWRAFWSLIRSSSFCHGSSKGGNL